MTDAPRYRLVGYEIGTAPDENGGWVHWTDHEVIVARLTAERDAAYETAERNLRAYCVSQVFKETLTEQLCSAIGTPDAAQADYEARILAAIQPDPEAHQAALAKAWEMGRDAAAAWHTMQAETAMGALCCGSDNYEIRRAGRVSDMHRGHSEAIRALTPPADLAAKIGGE